MKYNFYDENDINKFFDNINSLGKQEKKFDYVLWGRELNPFNYKKFLVITDTMFEWDSISIQQGHERILIERDYIEIIPKYDSSIESILFTAIDILAGRGCKTMRIYITGDIGHGIIAKRLVEKGVLFYEIDTKAGSFSIAKHKCLTNTINLSVFTGIEDNNLVALLLSTMVHHPHNQYNVYIDHNFREVADAYHLSDEFVDDMTLKYLNTTSFVIREMFTKCRDFPDIFFTIQSYSHAWTVKFVLISSLVTTHGMDHRERTLNQYYANIKNVKRAIVLLILSHDSIPTEIWMLLNNFLI